MSHPSEPTSPPFLTERNDFFSRNQRKKVPTFFEAKQMDYDELTSYRHEWQTLDYAKGLGFSNPFGRMFENAQMYTWQFFVIFLGWLSDPLKGWVTVKWVYLHDMYVM